MSNKTMFVVSVCVVLASAWFVWEQKTSTIRPVADKAVFITECRAAFEHCDADAFLKLIYTTDAPESKDLSAQRQIFETDCHKPIAEIKIEPLGAKDVTTYELKGVTYRPTLPPVGKLEIVFASKPNAAVHGETTSFLVGRTKDRWWILTAEPTR